MLDAQRDVAGPSADLEGAGAPAPGRETLPQDLSGDHVAASAAHGVSGASRPLPFLDVIQRHFGRHDVSGIRAHTDDAARAGTAAMGASAYAHGDRIAFAGEPTLHTAAHEAAHVVQQRAGVAAKSDAPGDEWERHADAVADRVVAGQSAEDLLAHAAGRGAGAAPSRVVQRQISQGGKLLAEWPAAASNPAAKAAFKAALDEVLPHADKERMTKAWNQLVKDAKPRNLDLNQKKVVDALVEVYRAKEKQGQGLKQRKDQGVAIGKAAAKLLPGRFNVLQKGIGPTLMPDPPATLRYEHISNEYQLQRQVSTVMLQEFEGTEAQASLNVDTKRMLVATNSEASNNKLRSAKWTQPDVINAAGRVARGAGLDGDTTRREAMRNRQVRHGMKVWARLGMYLAPRGAIVVPGNVDFEGLHAEIRIVESPEWSSGGYHLPSGTKPACLGCKLYFVGNKTTITQHGLPAPTNQVVKRDMPKGAGPAWLSAPALARQIGGPKAALPDLDEDDIDRIALNILSQYDAMMKADPEIQIGTSKQKGSNKETTAHDADSDSELSDDTFERIRGEILAAPETAPRQTKHKAPTKAEAIAATYRVGSVTQGKKQLGLTSFFSAEPSAAPKPTAPPKKAVPPKPVAPPKPTTKKTLIEFLESSDDEEPKPQKKQKPEPPPAVETKKPPIQIVESDESLSGDMSTEEPAPAPRPKQSRALGDFDSEGTISSD